MFKDKSSRERTFRGSRDLFMGTIFGVCAGMDISGSLGFGSNWKLARSLSKEEPNSSIEALRPWF